VSTDPIMIVKILSGGQTGVDRAALDVALALGLACGGWCPRGRRAEDGKIPDRYPLLETPSASYRERTRYNVRDADATLVLAKGRLGGGTALTLTSATRCQKPCLVVDLADSTAADTCRAWLKSSAVQVLNIAGPRESECPGIGKLAIALLQHVLSRDAAIASRDWDVSDATSP
jgi:hypothetical protein